MRRVGLQGLLFAVALFFIAFDLAAQTESGSEAGTLRAKLVKVMDTNGFEQSLVAFTILVPASWRSEGGVFWDEGASPCGGMGYNFRWQAASADGRFCIAIVPTMNWRFNTSGMPSSDGWPNTRITNIGEYLEVVVQRYRPGAQFLDYCLRPDLAKSFDHMNSVTPMPLGELRNWVEAGEVLIAYTANGGDTRETMAAA